MLQGVDLLIAERNNNYSWLKGRKLGFVTNNACLTTHGSPSRTALMEAGFHIHTLFSPEHSITNQGADGHSQPHMKDTLTGLPIYSLYSDHFAPTTEEMHDLEFILFELPDIGCRFYTYLWTMTYVMEACATSKIPIIILDRANPIGIDLDMAEGPFLDEAHCSSFIGRWDIPIRHSCTLGELAAYFNELKKINVTLEVIKVKNYSRGQSSISPDRLWIPPSPAITSFQSAILYPGLGLLEGIKVNEGRGTERPFTLFGAPYIQSVELIERLQTSNDHAVKMDAIKYTPTAGIYIGTLCHGVSINVERYDHMHPVSLGIEIIRALKELYPEHLRPRLYPTVANPTGANHLDRLTGVKNSLDNINYIFAENVQSEWKNRVDKFLIY